MKSLERKGKLLKIYSVLVFVFLYTPLVVVILFSFSPAKTIVGMTELTTKWYTQLLSDKELLKGLLHSFEVGISAVIIALVLGTAGAFFVTKVRFPGKGVFRALVMLPFVLPGIIMGLTLLIFIRNFEIPLSMLTILMGHVSFTTPIVVFQVSSRIQRMGPSYQLAAQDLGATPIKTFWYVTLPMVRTAMIGAALLNFILLNRDLDDAAGLPIWYAQIWSLTEGVRDFNLYSGAVTFPYNINGKVHRKVVTDSSC
jgi:spermidine/putrescine transport system permease protein